MDELAPEGKVRDFVVGCAFGPGISIEMCILKRNMAHVRRTLITAGDATPPETESEGSRSDGELDVDIPERDSLEEALNGVDLD